MAQEHLDRIYCLDKDRRKQVILGLLREVKEDTQSNIRKILDETPIEYEQGCIPLNITYTEWYGGRIIVDKSGISIGGSHGGPRMLFNFDSQELADLEAGLRVLLGMKEEEKSS